MFIIQDGFKFELRRCVIDRFLWDETVPYTEYMQVLLIFLFSFYEWVIELTNWSFYIYPVVIETWFHFLNFYKFDGRQINFRSAYSLPIEHL